MENIETIKSLLDGIDLEKEEGYMVGITVKKGDSLQHHLFTDNFPFADMLKSHKEVKELVISNLENREA